MLPARVVGPLAIVVGGLAVAFIKKKFSQPKPKSLGDKLKDAAAKAAEGLKSV